MTAEMLRKMASLVVKAWEAKQNLVRVTFMLIRPEVMMELMIQRKKSDSQINHQIMARWPVVKTIRSLMLEHLLEEENLS